jgi:hypothetical protein
MVIGMKDIFKMILNMERILFYLDNGRYYTASWINDKINGQIRIISSNGDQLTRNSTGGYVNGYGNTNFV